MKYLIHPIATEKAVRLIESYITLTFVVDKKAKKAQIKEELEKMFKVKVLRVNIIFERKNRKKAVVKLSKDTLALDVATQLGIM